MTDYINKVRVVAGVLILMVGLGNSVHADSLIKPTGAVSSGTVNWQGEPVRTYDGSGFSAAEQALMETGDVAPDTWADVDTSLGLSERTWRGGYNDNEATVTLTLHASEKYSVSGIHIWNYLESGAKARGTETFNIEVSSDNSSWTAVNGGSNYTIQTWNDYADAIYGETFDFGQSYTNIQYVRINTTSVEGYPGFDEIMVISPAPADTEDPPDDPEDPPVSTNIMANKTIYIIKPTTAASSGTDNWQGEPVRTYDGSGFSVAEQALMETGDIAPDTWADVDTSLGLPLRTWRGGYNDNEATVTLTLHASDKYSVSGIHIWNYIEVGSRGVITFNIEVSSDNSSWSAVNGGADYTIARGESGAVLLGETFDFGQTYTDIQYVRINTTSVEGYPGFDEIRLLSLVPPPSGFFFKIK